MDTAALPMEGTISYLVDSLRLLVETIGATIIAVGVCASLAKFVKVGLSGDPLGFNRVRLCFAQYLALALEFQLGGDILSTAIAPTWERIGKLAAIAIIRTSLNYFLTREIEQERKVEAAATTATIKDGAAKSCES